MNLLSILRRIVEAFRYVFASKGRQAGASAGGAGASAGGRRQRPRSPRCDSCTRFVSNLCDEGCGVCPPCCPGHREPAAGASAGDASGMHAWGDR